MVTELLTHWTSWIDFLEAHGFAVRPVLQPGTSDDELAALEAATALRLTDEIRALYRLNNGQRTRPSLSMIREGKAEPLPPAAVPLFGFYEFLDTRAVVK